MPAELEVACMYIPREFTGPGAFSLSSHCVLCMLRTHTEHIFHMLACSACDTVWQSLFKHAAAAHASDAFAAYVRALLPYTSYVEAFAAL